MGNSAGPGSSCLSVLPISQGAALGTITTGYHGTLPSMAAVWGPTSTHMHTTTLGAVQTQESKDETWKTMS